MTSRNDAAESSKLDASGTVEISEVGKAIVKIQEIIAGVEPLPEEYRIPAFRELLRYSLHHEGLGTRRSVPERQRAASIDHALAENDGDRSAISAVEVSAGLPDGSLGRALEIEPSGAVRVLVRIEGRSTRDRQIRIAQIVCYVREKALGEMRTEVEMIRSVCIQQGAYDSANFASTFRKDGTLREASAPGTKERMYLLAPAGIEAAANTLRQMAAL